MPAPSPPRPASSRAATSRPGCCASCATPSSTATAAAGTGPAAKAAGRLSGGASMTGDDADRDLTALLEERLPVHPASLSLKRRLAERWLPDEAPAPRRYRWLPAVVGAGLAAAALLLVLW